MQYLKLSEACERLGMCHKTLWMKVRAGSIVAVKDGIWRVDIDSIGQPIKSFSSKRKVRK